MRRIVTFVFSLVAVLSFAQGPNDSKTYYQNADGKKGKALKTAMSDIIYPHTALAYGDLWECYKTTDIRPDGKIWDMYSGVTNYTPGTDQAGNYSKEGDCYNREHSVPKSWFGDRSPMVTDLMHVVPTDGYVNGKRSNYPLGETNGESYKSANSFSKLGQSTTPGYSGIVFEPNDEYKGDFARIYFYMVTCYESAVEIWSSDMFAGNAYPALSSWALEMLLRWAKEDPVSKKEIDRNNGVYALQGNRNPFVDYPGLEQYIWGSCVDKEFSYDNYEAAVEPGTDPDPGTDPEPGIDPEPGTDPDPGETPSEGAQVFKLVTSATDLKSGDCYIIVYNEGNVALSDLSDNTKYYTGAAVTITDDRIQTDVDAKGKPHQLKLRKNSSGYTFYDEMGKGYLALNSDGNNLQCNADVTDNAVWNITLSDGYAAIQNVAYNARFINYNTESPRFAAYKETSNQQPVSLYLNVTPTGIKDIAVGSANRDCASFVYDMQGRKVGTTKSFRSLPRGIYTVGGKKVMK